MAVIALKLSVKRMLDWQNRTFGIKNSAMETENDIESFLGSIVRETDQSATVEICEALDDSDAVIVRIEGNARFKEIISRLDSDFGFVE